jgi:hypothetical protein
MPLRRVDTHGAPDSLRERDPARVWKSARGDDAVDDAAQSDAGDTRSGSAP